MLGRLFPKKIDNDYRGARLAIWLLAPIVLLKLTIGFNIAGFNPFVSTEQVLIGADGIPLDSFGAEAAKNVVFMARSWGLVMVIFCFVAVLALIRYRAMIPLVYLMFAAEQIGRKAISATQFAADADAAGGLSIGAMINWGFTAALVLGFILSLTVRRSNAVR